MASLSPGAFQASSVEFCRCLKSLLPSVENSAAAAATKQNVKAPECQASAETCSQSLDIDAPVKKMTKKIWAEWYSEGMLACSVPSETMEVKQC